MSTRSGLNSRGLAAVLAAALALSASPSLAAKASFSISPTSISTAGGAEAPSVINIQGDVDSAIGFGFVLPRDYLDNSTVKIDVAMTATDGPCAIVMRPRIAFRARAGAPHGVGADGLGAVNGGVVGFEEAGVVELATVRVRPGGGLPGMKAGDHIVLVIDRLGEDPEDTCGFAAGFGIVVRYRTVD